MGASGGPQSSEEAFRGSLFRVEVERWSGPPRRRDIVRHPGAAGILALDSEDRVVLVRQFREPVRAETLEIPAGLLDVAGESPEDAARRELLEEAGYRASSPEALGRIVSSPGFTDEVIDLFLTEAEPVGERRPELEVVLVPFGEAVERTVRGEILDAKTVVAVLLAARRREPDGALSGGMLGA